MPELRKYQNVNIKKVKFLHSMFVKFCNIHHTSLKYHIYLYTFIATINYINIDGQLMIPHALILILQKHFTYPVQLLGVGPNLMDIHFCTDSVQIILIILKCLRYLYIKNRFILILDINIFDNFNIHFGSKC